MTCPLDRCVCGHLREKHRRDVGYEACRAKWCACRRFQEEEPQDSSAPAKVKNNLP